MIQPPTNLVLEIPSLLGDLCPVGCVHCIHRNAQPSSQPKLSSDQIFDLINQGKTLGVEYINLYPHQGDITLEPTEPTLEYFRYAQAIGLKTKTVTSGVNPRRLEPFLPYINRLALSVDALDEPTYLQLRRPENYRGLMASLELLKEYRISGNDISLTALVMVNLKTIASIEKRVAEIAALGLFDKIKLLEMLPIGGAKQIRRQALTQKKDLDRLARIKREYQHKGMKIGVPLWRIKAFRRGCQVGSKDMVIGPRGDLAGCTLLYYINHLSGNIHSISLAEAWQTNFTEFRYKSMLPVARICRACPFFESDLCWGGCLARRMIFGQEEEIQRSCGVRSPEEARQLYMVYLFSLQQHTFEVFPLFSLAFLDNGIIQNAIRSKPENENYTTAYDVTP